MPFACARALGPGLRGGGQRGRHLVLESLPGARFDSESYTYGYSFSEELLQEWDWKEHYSGQPENERYFNYVADKFDLRRDIQFNARVSSAVYDERAHRWQIHTEDGHRARAQFLITAVGILSAHYIPDFAGLGELPGRLVSHREMAGGGYGPGWASGWASSAPRPPGPAHHGNRQGSRPSDGVPAHGQLLCAAPRGPIDPETQRQIKASYPDIFKKCSETAGSFMHQFDRRSAMDVSPEERLEQYERLWAEPGFKKWLANFYDIMLPGRPTRTTPPSSGRRSASASRTPWWRKNSCPRTICSAPSASL